MIKLIKSQVFNAKPIKFQRRTDLSFEVRLHIAFIILTNNQWGIVTQIAKEFGISRPFAYTLGDQLYQSVEHVFGSPIENDRHNLLIEAKKEAVRSTLILRFDGKCSIPAISEILKKFDIFNNSIGTISQILNNIGSKLSSTIETDRESVFYLYLASDEVFSHSRPILISVDPISSAILKIQMAESRETSEWLSHFNDLKANGINIIQLVSDEGTALCAAAKQASIKRQPDTFHAVSHRLGKFVNSLENSAYATIKEEYHCLDVFESAKTEEVMQKRLGHYLIAKKNCVDAINLYESFKFLYHCVIQELQVFDNNGNPRDRKEADGNIRTALDFLITLPVPAIKKNVNSIYNCLDTLLNYLDVAKEVISRLKYKGIEDYIIKAFAQLWQYNKNRIKAKHTSRNKFFKTKFEEQKELLKIMLGNKFEQVKQTVLDDLNTIVQSSGIVENINSIVRNFLNSSRNHINQNMLNLIMFYHNHRRYKGGIRKGKTPMELLTGVHQDKDWVDLLFDKANLYFS